MPPSVLSNPWLWLLGLLITSGFLQYAVGAVRDYLKRRAEAPTPPTSTERFVDQSLLAMSKANAQLEDDNERLRTANRELGETLSKERAERISERAALMKEIEALQAKLTEMSYEVARLARKVGAQQASDTDPRLRTVGPGESRTPPPTDRGDKTSEIPTQTEQTEYRED